MNLNKVLNLNVFCVCDSKRENFPAPPYGSIQREKEDEMTSFLDSHQSAAAVNKKLRFETSHDPILVIL